jgi:hypothetical protein
MSHPPLVPYVLAAVSAVAGGFEEVWLHLAFAAFSVAAAVAVFLLSKRFTRRPLAATLLVVASPVFVLGAQSLMTDMPSFALSSLALALFVRGVDERRRGLVALSGVLVGLAILARYSSALALLVMLAYAAPRARRRAAWPALAAAGLVLSAWCAQNLLVHGELHVLASSVHYRAFYAGQSFDAAGLVKKTLSDFASLGGTAFVAAFLLLVAGTWRRAITLAAAALLGGAVFAVRPAAIERLDTYTAADAILAAGFFALGVVLVAEALWPGPATERSEEAGSDRLFLAFWLAASLAAAIVVLPFGSARYLLPALPPLWMILVARAESIVGEGRELDVTFGLAVAQGALLAVVLSLADLDLATRYRAIAQAVRSEHRDGRLWFVGEWGFRYYMERAGGTYLRSTSTAPDQGDVIVRPEIAGMHTVSPDVRARSAPRPTIILEGRWPIRVMSFEAKAGYYSHHWGYLPWRFSRVPLERIEILDVRAPARPGPVETCASS